MTADTWTLLGAGDAIATHRLDQLPHRGPRYAALRDLIVAADVASVNLENSFFTWGEFTGAAAAQSGGGYLVGSPQILDDLSELGFHLFARGNNHAMDFGNEGLEATTRHLESRGLLHAGAGMHLAESARATYLDAGIGRVAMVSFATTFPVSAKAGEQRHDIRGRPGVNGVTLERHLTVSEATAAELRAIADRYGRPSLWREANLPISVGANPALTATPNPRDVGRVLESIEVAAAFADVVVVNAHSHEPSNPVLEVPEWFVQLAHDCVDAGADVFLGHGPHQLRGFEVYRDRPVFYSLGNFICQRDAGDPIPADQYAVLSLDPQMGRPHEYVEHRDTNPFLLNMTTAEWYESVVPVIEFRGDRVVGVTLHAIDLDHQLGPGRRGVPRLADPDDATRILERLARVSSRFGTEFSDVTGVVKL